MRLQKLATIGKSFLLCKILIIDEKLLKITCWGRLGCGVDYYNNLCLSVDYY